MTERRHTTEGQMPESMLEEGAMWFARMRGPDRDDFRGEFEKWLQADPRHGAAYDRASEVFAVGRFLAAEHTQRSSGANDNGFSSGWAKWLTVAAAVAIGVSFSAMIFQGRLQEGTAEVPVRYAARDLTGSQAERYVAGADRPRVILLPDGSTVTLAAGSALTRLFGSDRRELRLDSGEARFDVAHERRPFVVLAGGGSVTARGTIFDVRLSASDEVSVSLVRGVIDVVRPRQVDGSFAPFTRLEPGENVAFAAANTPPPPNSAPQELWLAVGAQDVRQPRVFERTPLTAVVAEARAASGKTIHLEDPSIGQLRVSGRFRIDDSDQVAERLSALFGLDIDRSASGEVTLRLPN